MTNNQVAYWTLRETARHNRETEAQGWESINETKRHNFTTEAQTWTSLNLTQKQLNENIRHNLVSEDQGQQSINESVRHNMQSEQIGFAQVRATVAAASISAAATQYAANRSAQATERGQDVQAFLGAWNAGISERNASANVLNAETGSRNQIMQETDQAARQFGMVTGGVSAMAAAGQSTKNINGGK